MEKHEVFISYKYLDTDGSPTEDFYMAQELYSELKKSGINVFFSSLSLEELGISEYKNEIDKTLDQCKVLIVVGTSLENINSHWVKYEWDSFYNEVLSDIKPDGKVFSYIDKITQPELPRTLRNLQVFERNKTEISDICRFIKNAILLSRSVATGYRPEDILIDELSAKLDDDSFKEEVELKFDYQGNFQLKYVPIEDTDTVCNKLMIICELLGIKTGQRKEKAHYDTYYDDEFFTLRNKGCSVRRRIINSDQYKITMKSDIKKQKSLGMNRLEYEFQCEAKTINKVLENDINRLFAEKFGIEVNCSSLHKILNIDNRRTEISLQTNCSKYTFCYDNYWYYNDEKGYSEYFSEIEIERESEYNAIDTKLYSLSKAINGLLGYKASYNSKLTKGLNWMNRESEDIAKVCAVSISISDFMIKSIADQKQLIQNLNHQTKEIIRDAKGNVYLNNTVYIPTGDGICLLLEDIPDNIINLVFSIQKQMKTINKNNPIKVGLNYGSIFKHSDIHQNLNYSGACISLSCELSKKGENWHILSSEDFFKKSRVYANKFSKTGRIYNLFDPYEGIGNPDPLII